MKVKIFYTPGMFQIEFIMVAAPKQVCVIVTNTYTHKRTEHAARDIHSLFSLRVRHLLQLCEEQGPRLKCSTLNSQKLFQQIPVGGNSNELNFEEKNWNANNEVHHLFCLFFFFLLKCIFPSSLTSQKNITTSLAGYWRFHSPGAFRMLITPEKRGAFEAVSLTQWWLWFNSPWDEMRTLFWPGRTFYNHR